MKRVVCLLLAMMLVFSMLVGCGTQKSTGETTKEETKVTEDKNTDKTENADQGPQEPTTFRIATVRYSNAWPLEFLESGMMKELEEKMNVDIEWEVYYTSDWGEQKALLLASDDLPDAFLGNLALSSTDVQRNKDFFVELTDLINENMPNLTKLYAEDKQLLYYAQNVDGEIYGLSQRYGFTPVSYQTPFINKTWLDNLGLDMPETTEDLINVLQAFKDQDANGNGDPTDEIPYVGTQNLTADCWRILISYGTTINRSGDYMALDKNGNPVFVPVQDNYKEAVKFARELYTRGLSDPEAFTMDDTMYRSKLQGDGGCRVGLVFGWSVDSEVGQYASEFVAMPPLTGPDGTKYVDSDPSSLDYMTNELVITRECQNPALLLQWADNFYENEIALQKMYGSIPECVQKNDDGTYEILLPTDGTSLDLWSWYNSLRSQGPMYMTDEFQSKVILPTTEGDGAKLAFDSLYAPYANTTYSCAMPVVKYTDDQAEQLAILSTDILGYCSQKYAHWVVEGGIDEEWDDYIKQLNNMGLQDYIQIKEDAYALYEQVTGK